MSELKNPKKQENSNLGKDKEQSLSKIGIKNIGLDESRVINKEYLHSLDDVYKCNICFKIMDNPTDCENCGHSFCYECINKLKCPFGCQNKSLKSSSMAIKNILSNLKFKCLNDGCKEIILYSDVKRHDNICEFQKIICPNNGCNKRLLKKDLENHVKNECEHTLIKCQYCDYKFDKKDIKSHENSCRLVNKSLINDSASASFDTSNIDTNEYLKLLSMNVSKIVKDNQELINSNININNEIEEKNNMDKKENNNEPKRDIGRVSLNASNFAQIDEDELLVLITNGVEEELKKYFLDFDRNFMKLAKDIQDIKEYFNKNNKRNSITKENKYNNMLIIDNEDETNINNNKLKNDNIIENNYNNKDKIFKKNINLINTIKEAKESDEEDNESSKTYIKNVIEKTEKGLKDSISDLNNKILDQLNSFNNKLEENSKNNSNNNLTNQQKLIIENINNSIDRIIDNLNETNSKINDLSNDFHTKTKEILINENKQNNNSNNNKLIEKLNNDIISSLEKNYNENYNNLSKLIDEKINNNLIKYGNKEEENNKNILKEDIKEGSINKEINIMNKDIENIQTQLSSIKNNVKQVLNILKEEFADLTDLVNKKIEKENSIQNSNANNNINTNNYSNSNNSKKEKEKNLNFNIDSLHKFSFSGEGIHGDLDTSKKNKNSCPSIRKNTKLSNKNLSPPKLKKINQNSMGSINNNAINNELPANFNSFQSGDNNEANTNNEKIFNSLINLENRMTNLENYTKNIQNEMKEDISNEFKKQVINFNNKIENNLDNKISKMFVLKFCKECEKVDYFYGFIKCSLCFSENCKQCIVLCISCKHLLCKNCCNCPKCNKSYCFKCRILCTECNKKYCKNCLTNCSSCNKQICLFCIKQCSNCKIKNCGIYCSKTCYLCSKNVCNKCLQFSNILKCSVCNNNICDDCSIICENCKKKTCKNDLKDCFKCKKKVCSLCYKECAQCKEKYCPNCTDNFENIICDICQKMICDECKVNIETCFLCSKNICRNCSSKCFCGNNYCNLCSYECEKCGRRTCNKCLSKCVCEVAVFCKDCINQNTETVLMHDCLYFINNNSVFDKKKTRSKISFNINDNFEAKFFIININKCSKLLVGLTDNGKFEENCMEDVNNIFALNLINGNKVTNQNDEEKFIDIDWEKEENLNVYIKVYNKQLFFKVNNSDYKNGFNLTNDEYWFYIEKNINENNTNNIVQLHLNNNTNSDLISEDFSSKVKIIYVIKI